MPIRVPSKIPKPAPQTGLRLGDKVASTLWYAIASVLDNIHAWIEDRLNNALVIFTQYIASKAKQTVDTYVNAPSVPQFLRDRLRQASAIDHLSPDEAGLGALVYLASIVTGDAIRPVTEGRTTDLRRSARVYYRPADLSPGEYLGILNRHPESRNYVIERLRELGLPESDITFYLDIARQFLSNDVLLELLRRKDLSEDYVIDILKRQGFDENDARLFASLRWQLLSINDLRELYLRGSVTAEYVKQELERRGVHPNDVPLVMELFYVIPPFQDIVRMAVRDAFNDSVAEYYGYDEDFPPEAAEWGRRQGLSEYWMKMYWRAHWELPSPTMAYEMLHRGIITPQEFDTLLKIADYPRFWREKLKAMSYEPYTRVDIRRMYQLGILNQEQVLRAYKDLGYDDEHAANLTLFTVLGASQEEKDLTKADILNGYKDGVIRREDAKQYLRNLGYDANEAEFYLARVDLDKTKEKREQQIEVIHSRYIRQVITEQQAYNQLGLLGVTGDEQAALLDKWKRELESRVRDVTRSDIEYSFKRGLISQPQALLELQRLHYTPDAAQKIVSIWAQELADDRAKAAEVKYARLSNSDIRKLYEQGLITSGKAVQLLEEKMYDHESALLLVQLWNTEIEEAERKAAEKAEREELSRIRKPTRSEIRALVLQEIIDIETARVLLSDLGYTDEVVDWLTASLEQELQAIREQRAAPPERKLSVTQIRELWLNNIIDDAQAKDALKQLQYTEKAIADLITLWQKQREDMAKLQEEKEKRRQEALEKKLSKSDIHSLYLAQIFTPEDASAKLRELGYRDEDIMTLLELWRREVAEAEERAAEEVEREKEREVRLLTLSQIGQLFKLGVVTEDEARAGLRQLRYSDIDIDRTIEGWKRQLGELA